VRPVPDRLILGGLGQLEPDVETTEEVRTRLEELVIVLRDAREGADPVVRDSGRAPVLQDVELDGPLLAGRRIDDLHGVEGAQDGSLGHLDSMAVGVRRPGFDHVPGGGTGAVPDAVVRVHRPVPHAGSEVERRRWLRQRGSVDVACEQERARIGLRGELAELVLQSDRGCQAVPPSRSGRRRRRPEGTRSCLLLSTG
jgi:hypothetical protein